MAKHYPFDEALNGNTLLIIYLFVSLELLETCYL